MRRTLRLACVIVLAGFLAMFPMPVLARGGGHGGGHVGGTHGGGGYRGGAYGRGGYGRGYGGGYYGGGFFGGGPLFGWGWGYPYYVNYGDYGPYDGGYYSPYVNNYYDYPDYYAAYPAPQLQAPNMQPATLEVMVPDPEANIWVDGTLTTETGTDRVFQSPPLQMGSHYTYDVRATWFQGTQPMTVDRQIEVTPGARTVVDFGTPATISSSPLDVLAR